jgi:hypothetical protein
MFKRFIAKVLNIGQKCLMGKECRKFNAVGEQPFEGFKRSKG